MRADFMGQSNPLSNFLWRHVVLLWCGTGCLGIKHWIDYNTLVSKSQILLFAIGEGVVLKFGRGVGGFHVGNNVRPLPDNYFGTGHCL